MKDVYVHVEKETDAGVIVSGAKVVATGSALTHYNFIGFYGPTPLGKPEMALFAMISMDSAGVKLICRPSYELHAATLGSPFDYPLSSRLDENDAILILDKVLIPWGEYFCLSRPGQGQRLFPRLRFYPAFHPAWLHTFCGEVGLSGGGTAESNRSHWRAGPAQRPGTGRGGTRLAAYVLGPDRGDDKDTRAMGQWGTSAQHGVRFGLSHVELRSPIPASKRLSSKPFRVA